MGSYIGFAFQIYFDFSGYSDIARGIAKWMGLHFRLNFNHPYISTSLKEFWTRWHISLSTWFRDYVYIPLGGSKKGKFRSHINMWITMVVSGFWHGAAWNFIIWGALHAFYLSMERVLKLPKILNKFKLGSVFSWILLMIQVSISWVFFRAQTFQDAIYVIKRMFGFDLNMEIEQQAIYNNALIYIIIGLVIELYFFSGIKKYLIIPRLTKQKLQFIQFVLLIIVIILFRGKGQEFIYFQF